MASRAILRRKSIVSDYLNVYYARSAQSFQSLGNSAQTVDSQSHHSLINHPPSVEASRVAKVKPFTGGYGLLLPSSRFRGSSHFSRTGFGGLESGASLGMRYISVSIRNATTTAAASKKPEEEDKKDGVSRKEASPEECDQAVESLSSVKAKAKAKRLQESKKVARSIVQRTWAFVLRIGPALRAVASMSRFLSFFLLFVDIVVCVCSFIVTVSEVLFFFSSTGRIGLKSLVIGNMSLYLR